MLYICLLSRIVQCSSSMGQQKVPWALYFLPRYNCISKGNNTKINSLTSYMYIHVCWAISYSGLQKHCNVWQFWIACDVALHSIGITLSIVKIKYITPSWLSNGL